MTITTNQNHLLNKMVKSVNIFQTPLVVFIQSQNNHPGNNGMLQLKSSCCRSCSETSFKNIFFGLFPIMNWLPKYKWKNQLFGDIMSGCTVAIMHIPQG